MDNYFKQLGDVIKSATDQGLPSKLFSWDDKQHLQQETNRTQLVQAVADAVGDLIEAVTSITLAINQDTRVVPPSRPVDIVPCEDKVFRDLLVPHRAKLQASFGIAAAKKIWNQRKRLTPDRGPGGFDTSGSLKKVAVLGKFDLLSKFDIGLDSTAPGTHTRLKRTKGPHRGRLSNYAMEAELQSRRVDEIEGRGCTYPSFWCC
ncbi:hypothetical protein JG687_00016438 [Phytophthora cactorum]|uniref:Uncharacterized protein n=1 Tax=Phytophthora cactorum TaxID=29920 RepID=A0A8T1TTS9_9STRA|nr:hypothetical protein JG687_00016438 [Phytophthora cactorum]